MKFYSVFLDEGSEIFTSLAKARKEAQEQANYIEAEVEIELIETPPLTKTLFMQVVNSQGGNYVVDREIIEVIHPKRTTGEQT